VAAKGCARDELKRNVARGLEGNQRPDFSRVLAMCGETHDKPRQAFGRIGMPQEFAGETKRTGKGRRPAVR
jgi:hypothetical protein